MNLSRLRNRFATSIVLWSVCLLKILAFGSPAVQSAEWQWSVLIPAAKEVPAEGQPRAFLWVPPQCLRVRAVIVAQNNLEEIQILEQAEFRQQMAELGVAEVWSTPGFDLSFRFDNGAGETCERMLQALAEVSGYQELATAPVIPLGHSAAASFPWYFAAWKPDRVLAAISVSGQWPYFRDRNFAPDIWGDRNIDGVPGIVTLGEFEDAESRASTGLAERMTHPQIPLSMLACPGEGHFSSTDKKTAFLAFYIRKALQYRLPVNASLDAPVKLQGIDPTSQGWLIDRWHKEKQPATPPAKVDNYQGNPKQAFWCFDEEHVTATLAYQSAQLGGKPQLIGYVQNENIVPQSDTHQQVNLAFLPEEDGITFKLRAEFLPQVPGESERPANWTGLKVGTPLDHSHTGPIIIHPTCGPVIQLNSETFALDFGKVGFANRKRSNVIWFEAAHPGDVTFHPATQQALLTFPLANTVGADQVISFPELPSVLANSEPLTLQATSDSGLPVHYAILSGPAAVVGNRLHVLQIPPRAKYPVEVTIVAWQYGASGQSPVKSAQPITRRLQITGP